MGQANENTPMEQLQLRKQQSLHARAVLPASKSICNRALIINALAGGCKLKNVSSCDDSQVVVRALGHLEEKEINIGAAGTAMRFLTAYLSVSNGEHVITGTERMKQRPIAILVDALRGLGADIEYVENEGFPPLRIKGRELTGGEISIEGSVSSQYISALLMVGATMHNGLILHLTGEVVSRPYIDMTLAIMRQFGARAEWVSDREVRVGGGYTGTSYTIENDWSSASYWYEMMVLTDDATAEVVLPDLYRESLQGDSRIQHYFAYLGVRTEFVETNGESFVRLSKGGEVAESLTLNLVNEPDMAQTLVVCCCLKGVKFRFEGLQSLKIKETDRISALRKELEKLGYVVREEKDSVLWWDGERCETTEEVAIDTYEDHRMAMAFAPACFVREGIMINNPKVVSKSYPEFWETFPQDE